MKQKSLPTWEDALMIAVAILMIALVGGPLVVLMVENGTMLMTEVPLTVFSWHALQVPLGLILLLSGLLGALLLYIISKSRNDDIARLSLYHNLNRIG